nr:hypothetical protein [Amycolatopsis sp. H20-H5]
MIVESRHREAEIVGNLFCGGAGKLEIRVQLVHSFSFSDSIE